MDKLGNAQEAMLAMPPAGGLNTAYTTYTAATAAAGTAGTAGGLDTAYTALGIHKLQDTTIR